MLIKIDSENFINPAHIVAISTFTSPDGRVKITIDTVPSASSHGPYHVITINEEEAARFIKEMTEN
ncbi:hypothetical protein LF296_11575 [Acinetobacter vivianii]|uniref:Uncharacterized protein n=1 Tax=Acinetobacter vivianii TaxID=1776742 RepID=A0AAJ6NGL9_9GAMM|nr:MULTISPECIES: hypothetical protein [Acinetobacter]MBJ9956114.1 hypothetical protein [Acinetobacter courvalinii]MCU4576074.1 hypothetical protein [Acinetobacter courvalinii]WDZ49968.1 hypothetical protein LF296_11575 [Acinetobacter vivianii]